MLSLDDHSAITGLIALHGHLVDDGRLEELNLVFADDVTHDLTAFGLGVHHGLSGVRESARALGDANPVGHHVTNIVIVEVKDNYTVVTRSKGIGIRADGTAGSVVYEDTVEWNSGFGSRMGLVRLAHQTQQRTIKASACWYRELIRSQV